ncbi:hypothetical protein [Melittangium boletus]|uniref:Lipoprotein n=1 Tax=Melittangium boletus DSM 14713 TaxID=1294270 RepID=A0A250IFJ4_9BACT|nr:hypothetical protein [Melittangium boletus]ATB29696.1 hypothetical protein MEBOL_003151 [Melittangium boletus DSM 14713]
MRRTYRNAAIAVTSLSAFLALWTARPTQAAAEACTGPNKYITRTETPKYVYSSASSTKRMTFTYSESHWPAGTCLTVIPAAIQKGKWVTVHDSLKLVHTVQAGFMAHPITFLQTTVQRPGGSTPVLYWLNEADVEPVPAF